MLRKDINNTFPFHTHIQMKTSMGEIEIELYPEKAPKTVKNFLQYVKNAHYVNTVFHRVIPDFMIQGGGYEANLSKKPTLPPIVNEASYDLKNTRGTIAMARREEVDSAEAQFFINIADNKFLNRTGKSAKSFGYCVFGQVIKGMDVVDKIASVATCTQDSFENVPAKPIVITEVIALELTDL